MVKANLFLAITFGALPVIFTRPLSRFKYELSKIFPLYFQGGH